MMKLENKEVFAKNLRYYVDRSGKDDKDIAEVAGVSVSTFSEWVNAKKYPRIDKIEILANFFHIKKSDLIENKESHYSDDKQSLIGLAERFPEEKAHVAVQVLQALLEDLKR